MFSQYSIVFSLWTQQKATLANKGCTFPSLQDAGAAPCRGSPDTITARLDVYHHGAIVNILQSILERSRVSFSEKCLWKECTLSVTGSEDSEVRNGHPNVNHSIGPRTRSSEGWKLE